MYIYKHIIYIYTYINIYMYVTRLWTVPHARFQPLRAHESDTESDSESESKSESESESKRTWEEKRARARARARTRERERAWVVWETDITHEWEQASEWWGGCESERVRERESERAREWESVRVRERESERFTERESERARELQSERPRQKTPMHSACPAPLHWQSFSDSAVQSVYIANSAANWLLRISTEVHSATSLWLAKHFANLAAALFFLLYAPYKWVYVRVYIIKCVLQTQIQQVPCFHPIYIVRVGSCMLV